MDSITESATDSNSLSALSLADPFSLMLQELQVAGEAGKDAGLLIPLLKAKADRVVEMLKTLEAASLHHKAIAKELGGPHAQRGKTRLNEFEGLREHIAYHMRATNHEMIPGERWELHLQRSSTPTLAELPKATAIDHQNFPSYCRLVWYYEWDEKLIKAELEAGKLKPYDAELRDSDGNEIPQIPTKLEYSYHLVTKPHTPFDLQTKKRKPRVKKGVIDIGKS